MGDIVEDIENRLSVMDHRPPMSGANVYRILEDSRDEIVLLRAVADCAEAFFLAEKRWRRAGEADEQEYDAAFDGIHNARLAVGRALDAYRSKGWR